MNKYDVYTMNAEETQKVLDETLAKTYTVAELMSGRGASDDIDLVKICRERILSVKAENGEWVTANPTKYDWETKYQWDGGINWNSVKKAIPPSYLDDGAYGVHRWLVEMGAVDKDWPEDHEMGMIDYKFSTKAEVTTFVNRINKRLTELRKAKKI